MPPPGRLSNEAILRFAKHFERVVVMVLLLLLMSVVAVSVFEMALAWVRNIDLRQSLDDMVTVNDLREVFSIFLIVLIGVELMETVKMYLSENVVHVEVVFLVAMISVIRHVIEIDINETEPMAMIGTASIIVSLPIGYFLIKRTMRAGPE